MDNIGNDISYIDLCDSPEEWRELLREWRNKPRVRNELHTKVNKKNVKALNIYKDAGFYTTGDTGGLLHDEFDITAIVSNPKVKAIIKELKQAG